MKSFLRRHKAAAFAAALVLAAVGAVALAPWWIDLAPVRAKIERVASSALGGALTYERMDLSWFPRPEAVVRSARLSVPGAVHGTVRTVRVAFALLPLFRGRFAPSRIAVDGLDAFVSRPDGRGLWLEGVRAEGSFRSVEGRTEIALSRLSVNSPALTASGSFRWDPAAPRADVRVSGSLDGDAVRSQLLALAGDDHTISQICGIFRGGRLTSFSLESAAPSPSDLFALERMKVRATVEGASLRFGGPGLQLENVSADVAVDGGVLTAERATARVGRSRAKGGRVLVGLRRGDGRLRVEAEVQADLSELPALLARAVPVRSFREELGLVESLDGSAAGRIAIGECAGDLQTAVSISELRFSARYRRLPWPLRVDGGGFAFDGKSVGVSRMSGSLGHSTFEGLAARVSLGKRSVLESASGSLDVSLEDFFEGVRTRPEAATLASRVRRVTGSVHVDLRRVSGPLAHLGEASFSASGTFEEILLSFSSSSFPPLSIVSGKFAVDDENVRVEGVDARALDASLRVSGAWSGYRKGPGNVEATADGMLGAEAIRWGWTRADFPSEFRPAAPVALDGVRVSLAAGGAFSLAGGLVVAGGPRLTLDLAGDGKTMEVRDLTILDGETKASFALARPGGAYDARFRGTLDFGTIQRIFEGRPLRRGTVAGDVRATVPAEKPARPTAEGALSARGVEVPTPAGPVTVERLEARAAGSRVDVTSSSLVLDEQRFTITGSATLEEKAVALDMDVGTGDLAWTRVETVLGRLEEAKRERAKKEDSEKEHSKESSSSPLAIRGDVRVSLDSFTLGNLVFKPVLADVRLGKDGVGATVRKAELCGISTTGEARFLPGGAVALDARADASGADVNVPLTCLGVENAAMTGGYEAGVQVTAEGALPEVPRLVHGPLTFRATKGRIGKATVLTRILGVLNATDVFAGKSGARVGEAMPYESFGVKAELGDGTVSIREASLKAPSITMAATGTIGLQDRSLDLMVLSHPLSTFDKVVQAVPVVRNVLGRDFLAVGVKVTGTLSDPKVGATPARDVGKGLVGILERTLKLPVTVLDPSPAERK